MSKRKQRKVDPFYAAAHKILDHIPRPKGVRVNKDRPVSTTPPEVVHPGVGCMICGKPTDLVKSVRGRMLRSLMRQTVDGSHIDPTTRKPVQVIRVFPTYEVGRVDMKCLSTLRMILEPYLKADGSYSSNPQNRNEIEILQERITPRVHRVITQGIMDGEDRGEQQIKDEEKDFYLRHKTGVRVRVPTPYDPEEDEPVSLGAYRKFGSSSRGGIKSYDREVPGFASKDSSRSFKAPK